MKKVIIVLMSLTIILCAISVFCVYSYFNRDTAVEQELPAIVKEENEPDVTNEKPEIIEENNAPIDDTEQAVDPNEEGYTRADDFRIDSTYETPDESLQSLLNANKDYIESNGLDLEWLLATEWEYQSTEDYYSVVAYDGSTFHAVLVSVTNGTVIIDPE